MTALEILGIIVCAILLILCIPISAFAEYDEDVKVNIKYLFVKIPLVPSSRKKKKNKKKSNKNKSPERKDDGKNNKKDNRKKSNLLMDFYENNGFYETLKLINDVAKIVKDYLHSLIVKHLVVKRFSLELTVADEDCAETAEKFGKICAFVYPSLAFLKNNLKIKDESVVIRPDFINEENNARFSFRIDIKPFWIVNSSLYFAIRLLKRLIKIAISNASVNRTKNKFVEKSQPDTRKLGEKTNA